MKPRTPRLDRKRCEELIKGRSTNEMIAGPFRSQLRAALLELATLRRELDGQRSECDRAKRHYDMVVPAADAVLHETRAHSKECVCPMCRSVRGYRELIRARVVACRAKTGTGP